MKAAVNKTKLTAGCLVLVSIVWSIDMITGSSAPASASAASTAASGAAPLLPAEPADREALERFLMAAETPPESPPFERVSRDPFVASEAFRTALAPPAAPAQSKQEETASAAPPDAAPPPPFRERHKLEGVIGGRRPLALVDGRALRLGATLDGHRLITIERDRVVFDRDGQSAVLTLPMRQHP